MDDRLEREHLFFTVVNNRQYAVMAYSQSDARRQVDNAIFMATYAPGSYLAQVLTNFDQAWARFKDSCVEAGAFVGSF